MRRAVAVARRARERGNHPFGALLAAPDGQVLMEGENTVVTGGDPTGHAETNLVRAAGPRYSASELAACTMYASTEPCAMCAGAIYWSGIGALCFALPETTLLTLTGDDEANLTMQLPCRSVFAAGRRPIAVRGPYDLPEALDVHAGFWQAG